MRNKIYHWLTGRVSPMVYVMMAVSIITGFCFFTGIGATPATSILYHTGTLVDVRIWGAVLLVGASIAEYGLITNRKSLMTSGSLIAFLAWIFAFISFLLVVNIYAAVVGPLFQLTFQAYVYLAGTFDLINRQSIN